MWHARSEPLHALSSTAMPERRRSIVALPAAAARARMDQRRSCVACRGLHADRLWLHHVGDTMNLGHMIYLAGASFAIVGAAVIAGTGGALIACGVSLM